MSLSMELESLQGHMHRIEAEKESLYDQLNSEKLKNDRLENMVLVERTRSIKAHQEHQVSPLLNLINFQGNGRR